MLSLGNPVDHGEAFILVGQSALVVSNYIIEGKRVGNLTKIPKIPNKEQKMATIVRRRKGE